MSGDVIPEKSAARKCDFARCQFFKDGSSPNCGKPLVPCSLDKSVNLLRRVYYSGMVWPSSALHLDVENFLRDEKGEVPTPREGG